ncbi:MAG: hypothetical protein WCI31_12820 [Prolixibacteraceae bacterium]
MKRIEYKLLILVLVCGISLYSCTKDPSVVVTPKTLNEYITEFKPFVNTELSFARSRKVGYDKSDYSATLNAVTATAFVTIQKAYVTALVADSLILVTPTVTIPQIVSGNQAIGTPGKAFWTGINLCDKRPLNDAITVATTLNSSIIAGTAIGNVSVTAKADFTLAIKNATTVRDAATTTIDRQVTEAIDKLKTATTLFNSAIIK